MKQLSIYIAIFGLLLIAPSLWGQETKTYPVDTIDGKTYYRYAVERSIGLYRISVNFDVKQEEILEANPQLQKRGLRFGEEILIPVKEAVQEVIETKVEQLKDTAAAVIKQTIEQKTEEIRRRNRSTRPSFQWDNIMEKVAGTLQEIIAPNDSLATDSLVGDTIVRDSITTRLGIMLPFQTHAIKRDKNMDRFYDFYAGALIAIYQAQEQGQLMEIFTYDIGRTTRELEAVLARDEIHRLDAIIGPAYSQQVAMVIDSTRQDSTWIVVPFISKLKGIEKYPYILKFNPSEEIEADTLARYLAERKDSINCVLVEAREGDIIPSGIASLHKALKRYQVPQTTVSIHSILVDSIDEAFVPDVENIIIFNTEKYANLQAVMPHLLKAYGRYRITLFSHYSWQDEKIVLPHIYTSVFSPTPVVDERYEELYRHYFGHELVASQPRYDLLGYDLTSHFLHLMEAKQQADSLSNDSVFQETWEGAQANIRYQPVATGGGLENQVIHIIHQ